MNKIEYIRDLVKILRMLNKINNVNTEDELLLQQLQEAEKRKNELEDKMKKGTITPEEQEELRRSQLKQIEPSENDLEKTMLELKAQLANSNQEMNQLLLKQLEEAQKEISEDHETRFDEIINLLTKGNQKKN